MRSPDREKIASDWSARGFSCDLWIDPPGKHWENYSHRVDEVVLVLSGNMEFEVQGNVFHPEMGEEVFIPAEAVHSARNIGSHEARWLYGYKQS